MFSFVQPAVRYSELDNHFRTHPRFPAPSVFWDWEKLDLGLRMGLIEGMIDLTVEWNDNTFVRAGRDESADEFLATVRWQRSSRAHRRALAENDVPFTLIAPSFAENDALAAQPPMASRRTGISPLVTLEPQGDSCYASLVQPLDSSNWRPSWNWSRDSDRQQPHLGTARTSAGFSPCRHPKR